MDYNGIVLIKHMDILCVAAVGVSDERNDEETVRLTRLENVLFDDEDDVDGNLDVTAY